MSNKPIDCYKSCKHLKNVRQQRLVIKFVAVVIVIVAVIISISLYNDNSIFKHQDRVAEIERELSRDIVFLPLTKQEQAEKQELADLRVELLGYIQTIKDEDEHYEYCKSHKHFLNCHEHNEKRYCNDRVCWWW